MNDLRELDAACARALGWTDVRHVNAKPGKKGWQSRGGWRGRRPNQVAKRVCIILPFSTDPTAARLLEDEIERRGLQEQYVVALGAILGMRDIHDWLDVEDWWLWVRATPEQKARAFLAAITPVSSRSSALRCS